MKPSSIFYDPVFRPIFQTYFFLVGLCIGSFLNVCIYRIPLKQSLWKPRSHCPNCGKSISWYFNIPLLSYVLLRGRCANCKVKISPVYFFVELLTGIVFLLLYRYFGVSRAFWIYGYFASNIIVLTFIDYYHRLLPHRLTFSGTILGLITSFFNPYMTPVQSLIGFLAGGILPLIVLLAFKFIRKKEGMGHGDIFMLGMVVGFFGSLISLSRFIKI